MTIYVGNISHRATENDLAQLFSAYGEVLSAKIMTDKFTGKSRGFGFVEMEESAAREAIQALNEQEFMTRQLTVNEARPRTESNDRPRRSFDRNSGSGYGGGNRDRGGYRNNY